MISPDEQVALANNLMRQIASQLPEDEGAVLLLFPAGRPGMVTYISNANRQDMHEVLKGMVAKWDRDAEETPTR